MTMHTPRTAGSSLLQEFGLGLRSLRAALLVGMILIVSSGTRADNLDDYLALATGSFDTSAQAASDARFDLVIWHTTEIWSNLGEDNSRWTYTEIYQEDSELPFSQRINRYSLGEDGGITSNSYEVPDAQSLMGAWQNENPLEELNPGDLGDPRACSINLARTGSYRFEGGTVGHNCPNSFQGASYLVARTVVTEQGMQNWDRGFASSGEQVWGQVAEPYRFKRQGENSCTKPVLMLVHGEIFDRAAFGGYIGALAESGLYPANQGYYLALSPAIDKFEGEPPEGRGVVLARFPCLEAARNMWNSPEYEEIKALRQDASEFEVMVFEEMPIPDYVNW
ncbi:MAG: CpcT/CpeT family chromophore lyase [Gammaproteobacteria bacterium]|nr:CpcT/CpeT family chromophore lyase [Gammaproteobacteria bacterium]MCY4357023.1 CpcT/CpeT family chromophore lyase [Gammaproteobacteria bacterium]